MSKTTPPKTYAKSSLDILLPAFLGRGVKQADRRQLAEHFARLDATFFEKFPCSRSAWLVHVARAAHFEIPAIYAGKNLERQVSASPFSIQLVLKVLGTLRLPNPFPKCFKN